MPIGIRAIGAHLPPDVITNDQIAAWTGIAADWIETRTGVETRRYAAPTTRTSELAHAAVLDLVRQDPTALEDLETLLLATSTPDQPQPATAVILQGLLGIAPTPAVDLNGVCAGFIYALVHGAALAGHVTPPRKPNVLVVAADKYSSILDRRDHRTVSLFGDGAGAVLLGPVPDGYGIHAHRLVADGSQSEVVQVVAGGTRRPLDVAAWAAGEQFFRMDGPATSRYVMTVLPTVIRNVVADAGLTLAEVDRFVCHQANPVMLQKIARDLGVPISKVPLTGPIYGNTSAASVPITLHHTNRERPIERGERIVLAAPGGGLTAGAVVLTWY